MLFYTIFFIFFLALSYFCVGAFIFLILWMICGLAKPADHTAFYRACLALVVFAPACRFMADLIMRKIQLRRRKGGA